MQTPLFYSLVLIFTTLVSTTVSASCSNRSNPVPEGPFSEEKCHGDFCHTARFVYHQWMDRLELTYLVKIRAPNESKGDNDENNGTVITHTEAPETVVVQEMYLDRACALINAGFTIDLLVHSDTIGELILLPPGEKPVPLDSSIQYRPEIEDYLKQLVDDNLIRSFTHTCEDAWFYQKADLLTAVCDKHLRKQLTAVPFSKYFMHDKGYQLILQNEFGKLVFHKVIFIRGIRLIVFDATEEVDAICQQEGMVTEQTPLGTFCNSQTAREHLARSAKRQNQLIFIVDNSHRDFVAAMSLHGIPIPAIMTGVRWCLSNGLKIGYSKASHRLYCTPDLLLPEMSWEHTEL